MRIGVIGVGYVGLVTGVVFASKGHDVVCIEKAKRIVDDISSGKSPIYEPGIQDLLNKVLEEDNFKVILDDVESLIDRELVFICVNTPVDENGINYSELESALKMVGETIRRSKRHITVVVKSTVTPGTTDELARKVIEEVSQKECDKDFGLAVNPEFLREGNAIEDFIYADRIIVGANNEQSMESLIKLYESWGGDLVIVNNSTAEFIKYYSNAFLSLLISFSNEMANISRVNNNIDFRKVIEGLSKDKRLSPILPGYGRVTPEIWSYLVPGPGFGGSCLPKDLESLSLYATQHEIENNILQAVIQTNKKQPDAVIDLIADKIPEAFKRKYLVLGLTHKPNTDDVRESSSLKIIDLLLEKNVHLILHDPFASERLKWKYEECKNIYFTENWTDEVHHVDVILLLTAWGEYRQLRSNNLNFNNKYIVDTRYVFDRNDFETGTYISF